MRLRLIHWDPSEGRVRAKRLRAAGYIVNDRALETGADLRAIRKSPPDAVVIDLTRMPTHGREVALTLRASASTRHVPIVFVDGDPAKVKKLKNLLPDATYADWRGIRAALKQAMAHPPTDPASPGQFAGYSGTPLPKKLGIKPNITVALVGAPTNFTETLGDLPPGARMLQRSSRNAALVIWFVKRRRDLESRIAHMASIFADGGALWIAWPKQASGVSTDVTQAFVRGTGLANGLVDYKIAAIDQTWSGLKFARRAR